MAPPRTPREVLEACREAVDRQMREAGLPAHRTFCLPVDVAGVTPGMSEATRLLRRALGFAETDYSALRLWLEGAPSREEILAAFARALELGRQQP